MEVGDGGGGGTGGGETGGGGGGGGVGGDGSFNKRKMEDEGDGESQRSAKNPRSASPDFTGLKVLISLHVLLLLECFGSLFPVLPNLPPETVLLEF